MPPKAKTVYFHVDVNSAFLSWTAIQHLANGDNGIPVPYYTEDVSTKVVKIIQSYTGVVNKMVWRKN